jgi:2-oxoisovalerate dehydrogenase E1 component
MSDINSIELALTIRTVENNFLEMFSKGLLHGTVHTSVGQEFSAVAFCTDLRPDDYVFSNHRCHGHYIARTGNIKSLIAELMGKKSGVCGGIGGSQHLCDGRFFSNGPQGSLTPVAVGVAKAIKLDENDNIVICFIGDGTMGEGIVYESMNLASLYELPIIFVCENNNYAQSTPLANNLAGSIVERAQAFGLKTYTGNTWDYEELISNAENVIAQARTGVPSFYLVDTYRLNAHSKGDDQREEEEVNKYKNDDPLNALLQKNQNIQSLEKTIKNNISIIVNQLLEDSELSINEILEEKVNSPTLAWKNGYVPHGIKQVDKIYDYFRTAIEHNKELLLMGEDIAAPYGGAFNVTRDLSTIFPKNIISTPISEAGIVGMGVGLSLAGYKPFVEIMFGDFISYAFDQILSNASKFYGMYNGQIKVPLVIRAPMGGGRGYGPTHSQSLEKHFFGLNNISIIAPNYFSQISDIYSEVTKESHTVLLIENKIDYGRLEIEMPKNISYEIRNSNAVYSDLWFKPKAGNADVTIVTYGGGLSSALAAVDELFFEYEFIAQIVCLTKIYPLDIAPVLHIISTGQIVLTVEEGNIYSGFGAEVIASIAEHTKISGIRYVRVGSENVPIPTVKSLEMEMLINKNRIITAIGEII